MTSVAITATNMANPPMVGTAPLCIYRPPPLSIALSRLRSLIKNGVINRQTANAKTPANNISIPTMCFLIGFD